ncbi:hypothetical protein O1611_g5311 [Lasiodiplodia mahajangana]|uniref:Uncharacterized protein n=1 Tax=Lasiodiplodia mahajangana TaxID=1108764 RepID=A0ACC2JM35_9PEZI|nr:hypothetical protein O1611_g5311 [Lasiodiplodia mahajangana]
MGRFRQIAAVLAASVILVAVFLARLSSAPKEDLIPPIQGKNETVLFFINAEYGLSNVHLATASALLEKHPDIDIHIASFPRTASKVAKVNSLAQQKLQGSRDIQFHELPGPEYLEAIAEHTGHAGRKSLAHIMHPPGLEGMDHIMRIVQAVMSPWDGREHAMIYERTTELIGTIDPAVIVLDIAFRPTIDAVMESNRLYAFLAPNVLADTFWQHQPVKAIFGKLARMGCDFSSPIPWRKIPHNIYYTFRLVLAVLTRPDTRGTQKYLREHGIKTSIRIVRPDDRPWLAQNMPGASIALDVMPPNVTAMSPIIFEPEPAVEVDPELVAWLARAPTVLINLGSLFVYSEHHATTMAQAIEELLAKTNVQVLWKMDKEDTIPDNYTLPAQSAIAQGRLRVTNWLTVSPASILATGHVVASVHHGGANCYHEAIAYAAAKPTIYAYPANFSLGPASRRLLFPCG